MIISIEGKMGSGKTLTTTMLGFDAFKQNRKVLANYKLNFPYEVFGPEDFYRINDQDLELNNCMVLADEGYLMMDSRNSMSIMNRLVNYWSVQTRKRNVDLVIATHEFTRLDKRIRSAVDLRIGCRYELRGSEIAYKQNKAGHLIMDPETGNPKKARDKYGNPIFIKKALDEMGKVVTLRGEPKLRLMFRNMMKGTVNLQYINPIPFMKYYDTEEIISIPEGVMNRGL